MRKNWNNKWNNNQFECKEFQEFIWIEIKMKIIMGNFSETIFHEKFLDWNFNKKKILFFCQKKGMKRKREYWQPIFWQHNDISWFSLFFRWCLMKRIFFLYSSDKWSFEKINKNRIKNVYHVHTYKQNEMKWKWFLIKMILNLHTHTKIDLKNESFENQQWTG